MTSISKLLTACTILEYAYVLAAASKLYFLLARVCTRVDARVSARVAGGWDFERTARNPRLSIIRAIHNLAAMEVITNSNGMTLVLIHTSNFRTESDQINFFKIAVTRLIRGISAHGAIPHTFEFNYFSFLSTETKWNV